MSSSFTVLTPTAIEEQAVSVRNLGIMWERYRHASLIEDKELETILLFDKQDSFAQQQLLEQEGQRYVTCFLTILRKLNKDEPVKYLLTMIDDIITLNHGVFIPLFAKTTATDESLPFGPLLRYLDKDDDYITQKTSKIVTALVTNGCRMRPTDFEWFFGWICNRLRSNNDSQIEMVIQCLQSLLLVDAYRTQFFQTQDGIARLIDILKYRNPNFQMQYQVVFCLWLLTFNKAIASVLNRYDAIPLLVDITRGSLKEKVIRVCLAALRNLLEKAPEANMTAMTDNKLLQLCNILAGRKWTDEDIGADIEFLQKELQKNVQDLSSFEEYASEVRSGKLEWSPVHRAESFWRANATLLNENDYDLLRILARLLSTSTDPNVLAVACHDIGEYVRVYPRGKRIVQELGAKQRIMELMGDSDSSVRYEALLAVQKFMVSNWEYLNKSTNAAVAAAN